ncbi:hypothetical protein [Winogradskyella sp. UBA3174]|uniref:hypothetical protein n=1 Tax=Winogradskyella sp. UBA3174 TaxID=1947785 RepID=UPI0025EA697F|nr:hypothetical protein [Winogradskyella sp. UBA3174]|tara:strand:+ start:5385 stop:5699 length:315 start_codon:yes stop_codon:yes gene_type:complete
MKMTQNGAVRWKSKHWVYLSIALKGKYVGVEELGNGIRSVFYYNVFLGYFDDMNIRNKQILIRLSQNLVYSLIFNLSKLCSLTHIKTTADNSNYACKIKLLINF